MHLKIKCIADVTDVANFLLQYIPCTTRGQSLHTRPWKCRRHKQPTTLETGNKTSLLLALIQQQSNDKSEEGVHEVLLNI